VAGKVAGKVAEVFFQGFQLRVKAVFDHVDGGHETVDFSGWTGAQTGGFVFGLLFWGAGLK
jgi:hypothetical protein